MTSDRKTLAKEEARKAIKKKRSEVLAVARIFIRTLNSLKLYKISFDEMMIKTISVFTRTKEMRFGR
jgi:hypothetical protein